MVQATLDAYLSIVRSPPRSGTGLFDLPFDIRCRIYRFAGLNPEVSISLNLTPNANNTGDTVDDENGSSLPECHETYKCARHQRFAPEFDCGPIPYQLLYISRAVLPGGLEHFYTRRNLLESRLHLRGGFATVYQLSPRIMSILTDLHICFHLLFWQAAMRSQELLVQQMQLRPYAGSVS